MSERHTPCRVRVVRGWLHPLFDGPSPSHTNGDTAICEPLGPDKGANARRLAACWNACHDAGLSTEALEDGVVKDLRSTCGEFVRQADRGVACSKHVHTQMRAANAKAEKG